MAEENKNYLSSRAPLRLTNRPILFMLLFLEKFPEA
jgi:hypothetical protein